MVLLAPEGHYLAGVTFAASKEGPDLERIENLADTIIGAIRVWMQDHHIREMLVAIEHPILRAGKRAGSYGLETYRKQITLLHAIEAGLWDLARDPGGTISVREISPSASKRLATGDGAADKDAMVAASPFSRRDDMRKPTREALADAWAHGVAGKLIAGDVTLVDLSELVQERLAPKFVDTRVWKVETR
jgi:hypothetical protein